MFTSIKNYSFLCFVILMAWHAMLYMPRMQAMDQAVLRTPTKTFVLFNPDIQPTIVKSLTRALKADVATVAVDSFILTDPKIINLLIAIHKKNPSAVTMHLHHKNASNKKTIQQLEAEGITVEKSAQHAKRVCIEFKDNHETEWHRHTISGSYNLTQNAQKNKEMMVVDINDSPAHNAHKKSHEQGKKRDRTSLKETVTITPQSKTIIDNSTHDLHASLAPRIANTQTGDILYFASMNYGDQRLHAALLDAAKRKVMIHLLLDVDAASKKNQPLLDELTQEGVNISFPTGTINTKESQTLFQKVGIFHQKYLVRVCGTAMLTYVSTANATNHASHDYNVSTFYPKNDTLARDIIAMHTTLATHGTTYQAFKASKAELPKRKKAQKKLWNTSQDSSNSQTQSITPNE